MYEQLIPIILPVVICTGIGFIWARLSLPMDREFMTRLIMYVGTPCLILQGIAGLPTGDPGFLRMVGLALAVHGGCALLGGVVLQAFGQPVRSYLPVLVFGNSTNMGLPLCMFAFGKEGLGLGVGYVLVGSVGQFVIGPLVQGRASPLQMLRETPVIYAAAIGITLLVLEIPLPRWAVNTVGLLGSLAIPLMLLALGHALATITVQRLPLAAILGFSRLLLGLALALLLVESLELDGAMRGVLLIQASMPVAVFSYLFAARYARHPEDAASAILISTAASFVTLPGLVLLALNG